MVSDVRFGAVFLVKGLGDRGRFFTETIASKIRQSPQAEARDRYSLQYRNRTPDQAILLGHVNDFEETLLRPVREKGPIRDGIRQGRYTLFRVRDFTETILADGGETVQNILQELLPLERRHPSPQLKAGFDFQTTRIKDKLSGDWYLLNGLHGALIGFIGMVQQEILARAAKKGLSQADCFAGLNRIASRVVEDEVIFFPCRAPERRMAADIRLN